MPSTFSWLDYSEHDRRRALDVIDQFREQETRDELGIGVIRDAFSDLFFPGTGTVQTRARYFFFVPWIYRSLEQRRCPSQEVKAKARRAETRLIDALLESGETEGVIGRLRGSSLKRLPSSIYWQGLMVLQILRFRGSQDRYHRSLDNHYRGGLSLRSDDGELLQRTSAFNWDPSLPDAPAGFPDGATLMLRPVEADYLRERITQSRPESLFRHLAELEDEPPEILFPWDHPALPHMPDRLRSKLEHARNFSELMHGAALLYNLILARLSGNDPQMAKFSAAVGEWLSMLTDRRAAHRGWDRDDFWRILAGTTANISPHTRDFVRRWLDFALSDGVGEVSSSPAAQTMVRQREIQLKRKQARVLGGRPLELWQGDSGTGRLNYRWPIASRILFDLYDAKPVH
jgi:hypothetical protein